MIGELVLTITGTPVGKGSLKCVGRNGRHQLVEDNPGTARWRTDISTAATLATTDRAEKHEAIGVEITTTLPRPQGHYGTGRNAHTVRPTAPQHPTALRTGDVDKLARLVLDALQDAHILDDDAQVTEVLSRKCYPGATIPDALTAPGVRIRIYPIEDTP